MRPRPVLVLLATVHFAACATWAPVVAPPRDYIESRQPGWVRVHDAWGHETVLRSPFVRGDSIAEYEMTCRNRQCQVRDAAVPFDAIVAMDVRVTDGPRTALAILGFAVALLGVAIGASGGLFPDGAW